MPERSAPVVVVTGPTASGKSQAALELAERFDGEIVNADSMQVYRLLDVGTAKPSAADRARVPHHLFDVVDPDVQYDASRYARDAEQAIAAIHTRGRVPFVVGGSGLYIKALLEGLSVGVGRTPELRAALEAEDERARAAGDPERLHRRLAEIDPTTARALHPNDRLRIVRALELHAATGVAPSVLQRRAGAAPSAASAWRVLQLALDPGSDALAHRIDRRCEAMIAGGLLQEVRRLRDLGYGPELPSMRAIGYRHMQPVVDGLDTLVNVLEAMKRDTRRFARRQRTWLRGVADVEWMAPEPLEALVQRVKRFLEEAPVQPPVV
jgi:tRNA dimethylallyltransferase